MEAKAGEAHLVCWERVQSKQIFYPYQLRIPDFQQQLEAEIAKLEKESQDPRYSTLWNYL